MSRGNQDLTWNMSWNKTILKGKWDHFWFESQNSGQNLGLLRIWIGFSLVIFNFTQFTNLLGVDINGPQFYYLEQLWYFRWLGITHTYPLSNYLVFIILQLSTLMLMVGFRTRWAIVLMVLSIFYLKGVRDSAAGDDHHRYLMWMNLLFILLISKSNQAFSLDYRNKPLIGIQSWEASWVIRLMQVATCLFYFVSAIAKLRVSGLNWIIDGSAVQRVLFMKSARWNFETLPLGQWMADHPTLCWLAVIFTMTLELSFPFLALSKNTRIRILFFAGVSVFHIANKIMASVGFWATPLLFLIFFDLSIVFKKFPIIKKYLKQP